MIINSIEWTSLHSIAVSCDFVTFRVDSVARTCRRCVADVRHGRGRAALDRRRLSRCRTPRVRRSHCRRRVSGGQRGQKTNKSVAERFGVADRRVLTNRVESTTASLAEVDDRQTDVLGPAGVLYLQIRQL